MFEGLKFVEPDDKILYISEAVERYRKAGIGIGKAGFGQRPAIVVVDMQRGFTSDKNPLGGNMDTAVAALQHLLPAARDRGVPVIYSRVAYREDGKDCGVFGEKVPTLPKWFREENEWVPVDDRIAPGPNDFVITKKMPSVFFGTDLQHLLTYLQVDTLIVTGCTTSGCVRATVIDSMSHGYRTIIPEECVADRAQGPHKANLFDMGTKYADVVRLEAVLNYLQTLPKREVAPLPRSR
jgi:nicotinamidase-related amidase